MSSRLDIGAIAARAAAAPAGRWEAGPDCVQVPWCTPYDPDNFAHTDDDTDDPLLSGRWLAVREGWWHTGSPDPGPELWEFLAAARGDVLELVAEVRRLRAAQRPAARRSPRPGSYRRSRRNAPGKPVRRPGQALAGRPGTSFRPEVSS